TTYAPFTAVHFTTPLDVKTRSQCQQKDFWKAELRGNGRSLLLLNLLGGFLKIETRAYPRRGSCGHLPLCEFR
ncbi:hypothetical protein MKW98_029102, partial [Papaver atlanticum]